MIGVSRESRPRSIRGWVADLFCVKTRGVEKGDFVTFIRFSCQKAVQSQRFFLLTSPAKLMLLLIHVPGF